MLGVAKLVYVEATTTEVNVTVYAIVCLNIELLLIMSCNCPCTYFLILIQILFIGARQVHTIKEMLVLNNMLRFIDDPLLDPLLLLLLLFVFELLRLNNLILKLFVISFLCSEVCFIPFALNSIVPTSKVWSHLSNCIYVFSVLKNIAFRYVCKHVLHLHVL